MGTPATTRCSAHDSIGRDIGVLDLGAHRVQCLIRSLERTLCSTLG